MVKPSALPAVSGGFFLSSAYFRRSFLRFGRKLFRINFMLNRVKDDVYHIADYLLTVESILKNRHKFLRNGNSWGEVKVCL
jgi:hypothetical protein